jgi:uncharacterized membrane protein YphA (DoxX/SURF4 family)
MGGEPTWRRTWQDTAVVLARWALGCWFVYMGMKKALAPGHFMDLVDQYGVVTNYVFLNCIGAALPWFEVFCGLLLLTGVAVRGAALILLVMLLAFTPLVLRRALELAALNHLALCAVRFDCGCGAGEVYACNKLVENCLQIFVAAWLVLNRRGRRLCLRFSLWSD